MNLIGWWQVGSIPGDLWLALRVLHTTIAALGEGGACPGQHIRRFERHHQLGVSAYLPMLLLGPRLGQLPLGIFHIFCEFSFYFFK